MPILLKPRAPKVRVAALLLTLAACSDAVELTIEVTPGHESDAFTQAPPVTRVSITALDAANAELLTVSTRPGGDFTLGELPTDQLVRFEVRGTDDNGDEQMRGRSLGFVLGALEAEVFPVFAQRVDAWARPPGEIPQTHVGGLAAVLGERYLVLTGGSLASDGSAADGDPAGVQFYDMLSLSGVTGGVLASVPKSLAVTANGRALIVIDDERAVSLDFDDGSAIELIAPEGLGSYAQVAGGAAVRGLDATFIVGPTRSGESTDRILIIFDNGTLASVRLNTPRSQAAASWVEGVGLVIAGGSDDGAGVEIIADGGTDADDLPFPTDPLSGAVGVLGPTDEQLLLVCGEDAAGAAAPLRILALDCGADCAPVMLTATVGLLTDCSAHKSGDRVFVTGHNPDGVMESYVVNPVEDTATAVSIREARRGARVVVAPNGTLAIIGGEHPDGSPAVTVEMLFPSD